MAGTAHLFGGPLDGKEVPILARPNEEDADDWPSNIVLNFGDSLLDHRRRETSGGEEGDGSDYDFARYLPRDAGNV